MTSQLLNAHHLNALTYIDWPTLVAQIAKYAYFHHTQQRLLAPVPVLSRGEIENKITSLDFFISLLSENIHSNIKGIMAMVNASDNITTLVQKLTKGSVLDFSELNEVAKEWEFYQELYPQLKNWHPLGQFQAIREQIHTLKQKFLTPIRRFVDKNGQVDFHRHPELSTIFSEIEHIDRFMRQRISLLARSPQYQDNLQFDSYDVLFDRYVLPIKADRYNSQHGAIIARSETGATFYVEPPEMRESSQKRIILQAKFEEIKLRICRQFSILLQPFAQATALIRHLGIEVDELLCKALFAQEKELCRPELTTENIIYLKKFFHPLITKAVRNDIELTSNQQGLVISGPNTGGKTAALKAIVLCHLLMHYGSYVPAEQARLQIFQGIFYFGPDDQNLEQGLSSFAAEVKNYVDLFSHLEENNLVVIDEIFNSTSSEEASALAIGLLQQIHALSNCKILISTHHQMLKVLMHEQKSYLSAHMEFHPTHRQPTYRLVVGLPGSSQAIEIFSILCPYSSMRDQIITQARQILDQKHLHYEHLLAEVSQKQAQLNELLNDNESLQKQLLNQKKAMQGVLQLKMQEEITLYQEKLEKILKEANLLLKNVQEQNISSPKQAKRKIVEIISQMNAEKEEIKVAKGKKSNQTEHLPQIPEQLAVGERYYCLVTQKVVNIKSWNPRKNEAIVNCGPINLKCKREDLRLLSSLSKNLTAKSKFHVQISHQPESIALQIDGRGMRLEEFIARVELGISQLYSEDIPFLNIIHGHGEGVLKNWLRKFLKQQKELQWDSPEHSSDGATKVQLKKMGPNEISSI